MIYVIALSAVFHRRGPVAGGGHLSEHEKHRPEEPHTGNDL